MPARSLPLTPELCPVGPTGRPKARRAWENPLGGGWGLPLPSRSWVWAVNFLHLQGSDACVSLCTAESVWACVHVCALCTCGVVGWGSCAQAGGGLLSNESLGPSCTSAHGAHRGW